MKWHFGIVHMLRPREAHKMNLCIVVPDIITHTHTHTHTHPNTHSVTCTPSKEKPGSFQSSRLFFPEASSLLSSSLMIFLAPYIPTSSVQISSVAQSCPTLCDPMNCSTPGLPVHHQLLEFTQTHVHRVSDAIQLSHPLLSPSPPAPYPSQHQSLFQ